MNGYQQGAITGGIGEGLQQASANILNLYGMQRHFDMQQQNMDIHKQNADNYNKMMHYSLASKFERDFDPTQWMTPAGTRPTTRAGVGPQARRLGMDQTLDTGAVQPGANQLGY